MGWYDPGEYAMWGIEPVDWPSPMPGDSMSAPFTKPVDESFRVRGWRTDASGCRLVVCGKEFRGEREARDYASALHKHDRIDWVEAVRRWTPNGIHWYNCPMCEEGGGMYRR